MARIFRFRLILSNHIQEEYNLSFDPSITLSHTGHFGPPAVAATGNHVYVVWEENPPGSPEIWYRRSTNGGANFGGTVNLSNTAQRATRPAIAASNNLT